MILGCGFTFIILLGIACMLSFPWIIASFTSLHPLSAFLTSYRCSSVYAILLMLTFAGSSLSTRMYTSYVFLSVSISLMAFGRFPIPLIHITLYSLAYGIMDRKSISHSVMSMSFVLSRGVLMNRNHLDPGTVLDFTPSLGLMNLSCHPVTPFREYIGTIMESFVTLQFLSIYSLQSFLCWMYSITLVIVPIQVRIKLHRLLSLR